MIEVLKRSAGRYPLLTAEDEIRLGRIIQRWQRHELGPDNAPRDIRRAGKKALDEFTLSNQRLALHIAQRFKNRGVPLEDLAMAAMEGMITAYKRFDPTRGFRSSSYATWYATSACQTLCMQQGTSLRLSTSLYGQLRKILAARERLRRQHEQPTISQLAVETGLEPEVVQHALAAFNNVNALSIDHHGEEQHGVISPDALGTNAEGEELERKMVLASLRRLIATDGRLTPQQRHILERRYLIDTPCTVTALAQQLNCSREQVRALETKALGLLRPLMTESTRALASNAPLSPLIEPLASAAPSLTAPSLTAPPMAAPSVVELPLVGLQLCQA